MFRAPRAPHTPAHACTASGRAHSTSSRRGGAAAVPLRAAPGCPGGAGIVVAVAIHVGIISLRRERTAGLTGARATSGAAAGSVSGTRVEMRLPGDLPDFASAFGGGV